MSDFESAPQVRFVSDNWSGVSPEVMDYMYDINRQVVSGDMAMPSYGNDPITAEATQRLQEVFGKQARVSFVTSGTAANRLGLSLIAGRGDTIVCSQTAHILNEEAGAIEANIGAQLLPVEHEHGKFTVAAAQEAVERRRSVGFHSASPKVVSITNPTELGVTWTPTEVSEMADYCHDNGLLLHMDGCRLPNAAVAQNTGLAEYTTEAGVDVLSFGGAKNGLGDAEAVIVLNGVSEDRIPDLRSPQKGGGALTSKLWTVSGQFIPYLENDLWEQNATKANERARQLAAGLEEQGSDAVRITHPVETNQVFARVADELQVALGGVGQAFLRWGKDEVRFVASWSHTHQQVKGFLGQLALPS